MEKEPKIVYLRETQSTQSFLTEADKSNDLEEFYMVYTFKQTAGKGQGRNKWESEEEKNVCFSFVLRPLFLDPCKQYEISETISLAIAETVKNFGVKNVRVKWPNDIYVGEKKICGILTQNKIIGACLSAVYIGVGLNVNQKEFIFAPNPTSLRLETGKEFDKEKVLFALMDNIKKYYNRLREGKFSDLRQRYVDELLFVGEYRPYIYLGKEIEAKITSVNEYGHLVLQDRRGRGYVAELKQLQFVLKTL